MDPAQTVTDRIRISDNVVIFRTDRSPRWYCQYNVDGKQHKPSLKTSSVKQAKILAQKIAAQFTLGMTPDQHRRAPTIAGTVEGYLASQVNHVCAKTLVQYTRDLKQFEVFSAECAVRRLEHATAEHLEAFEELLRTQGPPKIREYLLKDKTPKKMRSGPVRPRTISGKMKTIRQMIKWAVKRRMLAQDPSPGYRLPPKARVKPEPFSANELKVILETAKQPYQDLFDFFRVTGLRNDELCWLMKADVDSEFRYIHIRAKKCPFTGVNWRPKHGNERIVPLCTRAAEIARRHHESSPGPWLFYAADTGPKRPGKYTVTRVWRHLRPILKSKGIDHGTIHTFRHCFCSYLANQNVSPFLVMKFMGHGSLDIVMTYYHAGTQDLLSGMSAVDFGPMLDGKQNSKTSEVPANGS